MMREKLHPEDPSVPPHLINPPAYSLTWSTSSATDLPDLTGLPSLNHAIYLMNTVAFHLGQTYRLFDEQEFEQQIRAFYANALQRMIDSRLWLAKFLLILAFGTAFHAPPTDGPTPPGAKFFVRAMSLVPDAASLWGEGLLAAEVLALASLYLYSTDQRESASLFVSGYSYILLYARFNFLFHSSARPFAWHSSLVFTPDFPKATSSPTFSTLVVTSGGHCT